MPRGSPSTRWRSASVTFTPMPPSSWIIVVTSCRCGTLPTDTGSSASRVAARMGKAAFFAPEMRTSPSRRLPPVICSLSIASAAAFGRRQRRQLQGVDFPAHALTQGAIHHLVALQRPLALERGADHRGLEMHIVFGAHRYHGVGQAGADQRLDLDWSHGGTFNKEAQV